MASIQMIKNFRMSLKFEQISFKIGRWTSVSNKTDSEFFLISTMWAKDKQSEMQMVKEICTSKG